MELQDALDGIIRKEEESRKKLADATAKADEIRLRGEEEATETYRKTRELLKGRTIKFRKDWESRLDKLEAELSAKREKEKAKAELSLGKKRKKAGNSG